MNNPILQRINLAILPAVHSLPFPPSGAGTATDIETT